MFHLSAMLIVFCFITKKQGIKCSPKGFPSLFPETKVHEFVESLRQEMCGGRFDKVVDGCTTEQVAGEKSDKSCIEIQRLHSVLRTPNIGPEDGQLLVGAFLDSPPM